MPKLLTQPKPRKRKLPPCGRIIQYSVPHSPFQKLIDARRRALDLSFRELAERVTEAGAKLAHTSLWIWCHNENGYPDPRKFTQRHLNALAKVLGLPATELQQAHDASRHVFTAKETPMPQPAQDAFAVALSILRNDRRITLRRTWVINLLERLAQGIE